MEESDDRKTKEVKLCLFCKKEKSLTSDFNLAPRMKGGYYIFCKVCEPKEKEKKRKCCGCGEEKKHEEFYFGRAGKRNGKCKQCKTKYDKQRKLDKKQRESKLLDENTKCCSYCRIQMNVSEFESNNLFKGKVYPLCKTCKPEEMKQKKKCTKCREEKMYDEFHFQESGQRFAKCRKCYNTYNRQRKIDKDKNASKLLSLSNKKWCYYCKTSVNISDFSHTPKGSYPLCKICELEEKNRRKEYIDCRKEKSYEEFHFRESGQQKNKCKECVNKHDKQLRLDKKQNKSKSSDKNTKWCFYCNIQLNISEFEFAPRFKDRHYPFCNVCKPKEEKQKKHCDICERETPHNMFQLFGTGKRCNNCRECVNKKVRQRNSDKKKYALELLSENKKWCSYCEFQLNITVFEINKLFKDGYYPLCISCRSKEEREKKQCNVCKNEKIYDMFQLFGTGKRNNKCKECLNKYLRQWRCDKRQISSMLLSTENKKLCLYCENQLNISEFESSLKFRDKHYPMCNVCKPKEEKQTKKCTECNEEKLHNEFKFDEGKRKDKCKECVNELIKAKTFERRMSGTKYCPICKNNVNVAEYGIAPHRYDGLPSYCKKCTKSEYLMWENTLDRYMSVIFTRINKQSKHEVLITKQDIIDLYHEHDSICIETNIKMTHIYDPRDESERTTWLNPIHYTNISVDRIDSTRGYIPGNIQLVCCIVNIMKQSLTSNEFHYWCWKIIINQEVKEHQPSEVLKHGKDFEEFMHERFKSVKNNIKKSKHKDKSGNVSEEDIITMYYDQNGECAISGVVMNFTIDDYENETRLNNSSDKLISVDRIDSSKGYNRENTQLVCRAVNYIKGDRPQNIFIEWCEKISNFHSNKVLMDPYTKATA